jgi:hypothetical protein
MRRARIDLRREGRDGAQAPVEHPPVRPVGCDGPKSDIDNFSETTRVHEFKQKLGTCRHRG